jgi:mRNA-degrading endonuclease YafQ of YafQ-DinJ toxin-antitoxin module
MIIYLDPYFLKVSQKLVKKNPQLKPIIINKIKILKDNPKHQSLRLHKLSGKNQHWSISVNQNIRIIFIYVKEGILVTDIGSHNQVY